MARVGSGREHERRGDFIQAFAGDNRYILDYLVEEVLQRQPEPVRSFLLQTAILATWVNVHIAATALGFFGLFGMAGLYARQIGEEGLVTSLL